MRVLLLKPIRVFAVQLGAGSEIEIDDGKARRLINDGRAATVISRAAVESAMVDTTHRGKTRARSNRTDKRSG